MKLLLLFLLLPSIIFSQDSSEQYISAEFQKGNGLPFKSEFLYSVVNGGSYYTSIQVISLDTLKRPDRFFLMLVKETGKSFFPIDFDNSDSTFYNAAVNLTNEEEDILSELTLRFYPAEKIIRYRWNNKEDYCIPAIAKEYNLKPGFYFPEINVATGSGMWSNKNKNKVIVINWWATSCIPCIEEMPGLNKLVEKFPEEKVEFLSIVWDKENLPKFLEEHEFNYIQGFGDESLTNLLGETFPRNLIIGKEGKVLLNKLGGYNDMYLELEKVIAENL